MYVNYYKLRGKAFGLSPDPKFFFSSAVHKQALSAISYGLGQGQGFVVVTGDSGTGKSTLMGALLHMLASTDVVCAKIINTQLQSDEMLRYVVAELNLPFEDLDKVTLLKSVEAYFEECRQFKRRTVIIIDEAQNLTTEAIEELRMLMNLVSENEPILQFVLFGQTSLTEQLYTHAFEPIRQRIVSSYHLRNFDEEETKAYVTHRLRSVAWIGDPEFLPDSFVAIHDCSQGTPAKINMLCEKILQAACLNGLHEISEATVRAVNNELSHNFVDSDFSNSIVEGVIDALVEEQQNHDTDMQEREVKAIETRHLKLRQMKEQRQSDENQEFDLEIEFDNEVITEPELERKGPAKLGPEYDLELILDHEIPVDNEQDGESLNNGHDKENEVPLVSEQITVDEALLQLSKKNKASAKDIDGEVSSWLQKQKRKITNARRAKKASFEDAEDSLLSNELQH